VGTKAGLGSFAKEKPTGIYTWIVKSTDQLPLNIWSQ